MVEEKNCKLCGKNFVGKPNEAVCAKCNKKIQRYN